MTIRIRCAECQRKLKVPNEALGKKIQCPACGARFRGRVDADPPPAPPLESPPPLQHPPLEMMAAAPFEETVPPEEPALAPSPPEPVPSPFMNLELEEPAMDAEAAAPEAIEPLGVEEIVAEEPLVVEETAAESEALDLVEFDDEPIEVVEEAAAESEVLDPLVLDDEPEDEVEVAEAADEDEPAQGGKKRSKKEKSRGLLYGCLAAVAVVMLLGCGGVGFVAYRYVNGTLFESTPTQPARNPPPNVSPRPGSTR